MPCSRAVPAGERYCWRFVPACTAHLLRPPCSTDRSASVPASQYGELGLDDIGDELSSLARAGVPGFRPEELRSRLQQRGGIFERDRGLFAAVVREEVRRATGR